MCLLFCVLLKFCNYFGWLAISLKTHLCSAKEVIKWFVEEFVFKYKM